MEIATGYFAKSRPLADAGYALVSIAKVSPWFLPKDLTLFSLPELAPTEEILALKDAPERYEEKYLSEVLSRVQPEAIYQRLWNICASSHTDKVVLLCYEAPDKFCHRHIVAKWLHDALGCDIREESPSSLMSESSLDDSDS